MREGAWDSLGGKEGREAEREESEEKYSREGGRREEGGEEREEGGGRREEGGGWRGEGGGEASTVIQHVDMQYLVSFSGCMTQTGL